MDSTLPATSLSQEAALALVGKIKGIVENDKNSAEAKKSTDAESEDRLKAVGGTTCYHEASARGV